MAGASATFFALGGIVVSLAGAPVIPGYSDDEALTRRVQALDALDIATTKSLGKTVGGRDVWLITLGTQDVANKPAIVLVGNVVAPHLVGSEIALGMAEAIARRAGEEKIRALLDRVTIYVLARPNPDGAERFFVSPYFEADGNDRKTDEDRDFLTAEDPPEDLNGDGFITQMLVPDPAGEWIFHPDDPRIVVKADATKNERGAFRVYREGIDNDHDEKWNEDPGFGASFNRNFPAKYPYFGENAGPNAVSEVETRAVADFLFDHVNVAMVITFSPEDNLFHPWKPANDAASQKIKTSVQPEDVPLIEPIAKRYRTLHGGKDCPESPAGAGSFSDWAYLQYGRWSFAARAWWIPPASKKDEEKKTNDAAPSKDEKSDEKKDDRGKDLRRALDWFGEQKIEAYTPWTTIEHPDFPGKKVQVGGVRPFFLLNPPFEQIANLVDRHVEFLTTLSGDLPRLAIHDARAEPAGQGVYRVKLRVVNEGPLPTMSTMGRITRIPHPLNWEIKLPEGGKLLSGNARGQIDVLDGAGGEAELEWLLLAPDEEATATFTIRSPSVGERETTIPWKR